jgi:hypothetical protein
MRECSYICCGAFAAPSEITLFICVNRTVTNDDVRSVKKPTLQYVLKIWNILISVRQLFCDIMSRVS